MRLSRDYQADVNKTLLLSPYIDLNERDAAFLYKFAKNFQEAKKDEKIHQIDNDQEIKRYMTGFAAELALEKMLGVRIMDTSFGHSDNYNHADLSSIGINVGIKCSLYGNYPVVFKSPHNAEIITVLKGIRVYVCGVATIKDMLTYCDDDLILNPKFKARGVKTGYYGFEHLQHFKNLDELKLIAKNLPKNTNKQKYRN